jgi:hypothetical protein
MSHQTRDDDGRYREPIVQPLIDELKDKGPQHSAAAKVCPQCGKSIEPAYYAAHVAACQG